MGNFNIVDDNNKKPKKKLIIAIVCASCFLITGIIGGIFCNISNQKPEDYSEYENVAKIYKKKDIEYSYDDWKKDKEAKDQAPKDENYNVAINENVSDSTKELLNKNDSLLDEIAEDTLVDTTISDLSSNIINQISIMNSFISGSCGYDGEEWSSESYDVAKEYISWIVDSMAGKSDFENAYDYSISDQQAELRYAISEGIRITFGNGFTKYNSILKDWMSIKHPDISIDSIDLEYFDEKEIWDGTYNCDLVAHISSNGTLYDIYLSANSVDGGESTYKVLDVRRVLKYEN